MNAIAKMYPKLSAVELSAILMKGAAMSAASLERDSGFNSGSSEHEDDLKSLDQSSRDGLVTPENSSVDSVEVKLPQPITTKNKRKSSEPLRVISDSELLGPIKKRIRYGEQLREGDKESLDHQVGNNPFRPWAPNEEIPGGQPLPAHYPNPADLLVRHPGVTTLHRAISIKPLNQLQQPKSSHYPPSSKSPSTSYQQQPLALVSKKADSSKRSLQNQDDLRRNLSLLHQSDRSVFIPPPPVRSGECSDTTLGKPVHPRNYKNMTRERRIEANARERTRVHTISAAYEKLRHAVPAYSNSQKLSKLSILRIACSYILTLSRMAGEDYSADGSAPSVDECVEMVTKTIQTEGKIKKKKDE
ncbi:transcription factor ATOH1 [Wyeomyia smithii]|uniref:transcription factor ATOH1 n=1 Tax=Wyeomyia smithii TaxID=174621 RepID=UPI002467F910|nr:transcription factor ATOH1 [Wyeomyia smithii]